FMASGYPLPSMRSTSQHPVAWTSVGQPARNSLTAAATSSSSTASPVRLRLLSPMSEAAGGGVGSAGERGLRKKVGSVSAGRLNRAKWKGLTPEGHKRLRLSAFQHTSWQFSTGLRRDQWHA